MSGWSGGLRCLRSTQLGTEKGVLSAMCRNAEGLGNSERVWGGQEVGGAMVETGVGRVGGSSECKGGVSCEGQGNMGGGVTAPGCFLLLLGV